MIAVSRKVGQAMGEQLDRVNKSGDVYDDLSQRYWEIQRLQGLLDLARKDVQRLEAEVERLRERRAAEEEGALPEVAPGVRVKWPPPGYITPLAAARRLGISVATVSRYLTSGWWQGQQINGRWLIDADQPLNRRERQSRRDGTRPVPPSRRK